jgi:TolB-like protein
VTPPAKAVFLSYASQDSEAAGLICEALRAAGIEVWFDRSELRGGDAWDQKIRLEIRDCALFIPLISANTAARAEGYFRLEWSIAEQRSHMIARNKAFIVPVCIDATPESGADVPESFQRVQWTRLPDGNTPPAFAARIATLLGVPVAASGSTNSPLAPPGEVRPKTGKPTSRVRLAGMALVALIAGGLAYLIFDRPHLPKQPAADHPVPAMAPAPAAPAVPEKSVAVLPFVDMSEKKDQEYFADGLSEELIDHLAHTHNLKVIARTSSFQFKGRNEDVRTIGQRLGVANLLEGSVRTSGKTVRVTAQLIKVSDGSHLWSETYDRDIRDIFKVQDAIAAAVVTALQMTLATGSAREGPANTEAYKALLRGRYFSQMDTKEDSQRAIASFREAIRLDPDYATAFAELAIAYDSRGFRSWMPIKEAYTQARAAIAQSLKLDPTLALAHRALGWTERGFKYDFVAARLEQRRADELDPAAPEVTSDAAEYALIAGHLDEAIRMYRPLVERNPLDAGAWANLAFTFVRADRLTEAEAAARTVLELNPRAAFAHATLGWVLLYEHKPDAALAMASQETDESARCQILSDVLWALGRHAESDAVLAEIKAKFGDSQAFVLAERYAVRNEKDEAFLWLDRAYENRVPEVIMVRSDESLRNLHDDPRWTAFLRKMNLPE